MKKPNITQLQASTGFCLMVLLLSQSAKAQAVFNYNFPASWNGTGSTITDQSSAGNNGSFDGTLSLSSSVPSGGTGQSVVTTSGGILTSKTASLNNSAVAAAGGFNYNLSFNWNGTDSTSFGHTQKLIDYSGTESLQLVTSSGSASLQMVFANNAGVESTAVSTTILPNTWYTVSLSFNTSGNSLDGNGDMMEWRHIWNS